MRRLSMAMTALAVMGLMTMVSCRKPNVNNVVPGAARTVTFNATTESGNGSKTYIEALDVKWSEGDQISVNGSTFTLSSGENTTFGSFTGTITGSEPYLAGYPQSSTTYTAEPKSLKLNLPAPYEYNDSKVEIPMVAITNSEDGDLSFRNVVNVLKLQLKGVDTDASKLTSIVLTSTTSNLNGDITVTFIGSTPNIGYADGTKTTTLSFGEGLQLTSTETKYVYVVLPKIADGDLRIRLNCANGGYMDKEIAMTSAFNAVNNMLTAPEFIVNATPVETDEWINFNDEAMGVTGMPIWAKKNLGATCSTANPTDPKTATTWYGDYYAWGEVAPYYTSITWTSATSGSAAGWKTDMTTGAGNTVLTNGYAWKSYSQGASTSFAEWSTRPYGSGYVLTQPRDAAYQNATPANTWRMPTSGKISEWLQLVSNTYFKWVYGYNGIAGLNGYVVYKVKDAADKGLMTVDDNEYPDPDNPSWGTYNQDFDEATLQGVYSEFDPHMFLPAAGCMRATTIEEPGSYGMYASSCLYLNNFDASISFEFDHRWHQGWQYPYRKSGLPIRPVR